MQLKKETGRDTLTTNILVPQLLKSIHPFPFFRRKQNLTLHAVKNITLFYSEQPDKILKYVLKIDWNEYK